MPRSDPKNYGKRRLPRKYEAVNPFRPEAKGLTKRLTAYDVNQRGQAVYDPPNGTRLHRPGSQNPRKH